jgi:poly-gamma-glutamate capsule biosynthesis protein CapA/YwtB (metallophosphatase superfamily)
MVMLMILVVAVVAGVAFGAANVISPVSTTTTASTLPATTTTIAPSNVTLSAVGDTELGNTPQLPADPTAYLAPIKAALAAPIVFGNLEGTMTSATTSKCAPTSTECYAFHVPTSYAAVYRAAAFTVLNAANNHSHDFGAQGAADTTTALRAVGIAQAGLPGQIGVVREGTTRVAFVDFAPYSNTNDLLNFTAAAQLIAQAKRIANVVVVYMHAGAEGSDADHVTRTSEFYVGEDRGNPYAFAHAAIDDGADLVLASGPHVLRAMEWYRGHLIAYSLGDFANYDNFAAQGVLRLSAILHVTLSPTGSFLSGHFTSVVLSPSGQPSVDPTDASAAFVNGLSVADFGANAARISAHGTVVAPAG